MLAGVEAVAAEEIGADERGIRLDEVEARSILAFTLAVGAHFLAADLPGGPRGAVIAEAGRRVLFER